jgi:hypothetical protein
MKTLILQSEFPGPSAGYVAFGLQFLANHRTVQVFPGSMNAALLTTMQ